MRCSTGAGWKPESARAPQSTATASSGRTAREPFPPTGPSGSRRSTVCSPRTSPPQQRVHSPNSQPPEPAWMAKVSGRRDTPARLRPCLQAVISAGARPMRGAHAQAATAWQIEGMPIAKPLLIFDGECTFCRRSAKRFRVMTEGRVDTRASQEVDLEALGVEPEWVKRSVVFVDPESTHTEGSEAIFRALLHRSEERRRERVAMSGAA